jgi:hypothetical protein
MAKRGNDPVRRAGHQHRGQWPSPFDGKSDQQNNPPREYTPGDMAFRNTNQSNLPTKAGKGNPGYAPTKKANEEGIANRKKSG